ncbi:MAG: PAS domain-containing protein [Bacillota bacterium]
MDNKRCEISFCLDLQDKDKILNYLEEQGLKREHVRVLHYLLIQNNQPAVQKAWKAAVSGRPVHDHPGGFLIQDAWSRCARLNIDPHTPPNPAAVSDQDLKKRRGESAVLLQSASSFFPFQLERSLARRYPRFAAMLLDADGICIDIVCDKVTVQEDPKAYLTLGGFYSEQKVGCNAIGLALRLRQPAIVSGSEHWYAGFHPWISMAAPVFNIDNTIQGVLAFWLPIDCASQEDYELLRNFSKTMESSFALEYYESRVQYLERKNEILERENRFLLKAIDRPVIVADRGKEIRFANRAAVDLFGRNITADGSELDAVLPHLALELDQNKGGQVNHEIGFSLNQGGQNLSISALLHDWKCDSGNAIILVQDRRQVQRLDRDLCHSVLDALPFGLMLFNKNVICTWCNTSVYSQTGYLPNELVGQSFLQIAKYLANNQAIEESAIQLLTVLHSGSPILGHSLTVRDKNGHTASYVADYYPLRTGTSIEGVAVLFQRSDSNTKPCTAQTPPASLVVDSPKEMLRIGVRWADIRKDYKLEKQQFADKLGLSLSQYLRYENGKSLPSLATALYLARKIGRPIEQIYSIVD